MVKSSFLHKKFSLHTWLEMLIEYVGQTWNYNSGEADWLWNETEERKCGTLKHSDTWQEK